MTNKKAPDQLSCTDCSIYNCRHLDKKFPEFCLTTHDQGEHDIAADIADIKQALSGDSLDARIAHVSAEIEGEFYGRITRVEEIIEFAKRLGVKKIGIATCVGLIEEAKIFTQILTARGLDYYSVICKVGAVDKTEIGLQETDKIQPNCHESMCNPILQAKILNYNKTDLNVIVGLCVGHDSLFIRHSEAPVTTLITKDRVTGHNPAAALYTAHSYYKRLLQEEKPNK